MFLALFLALPALVGDPAADAPLVTRSYELSGVLPPSTRYRGIEVLFPQVLPLDQDVDPNWQETDWPQAEVLINLIQPQFPGEFDAEGRFLQLAEGRRLVVRAPEEVQQGVLKLLQNAELLFDTSMELFVDVFRAPEAGAFGASCLVPVADAEKLLASAGRGRTSCRVEVQSGVPTLVDLTGTQQIVADYNIEIAQAATILDPIVTSVVTGVRLQACCSAAPGGSWIALTLRANEPTGPVRDVALNASGQITTQNEVKSSSSARTLQSVQLRDRSVALNAFLADGKALVLRTSFDLASGKDDACIVVRMGGQPTARSVRLGPVGKGTAPEVRAFQLPFARPMVLRTAYPGLTGSRGENGPIFPAMLGNAMPSSLQIELARGNDDEVIGLLRDENPGLDFQTWGSWLLVSPLEPASAPKAGQLDAIEGALARLSPSPRMFQLAFTLRRGGGDASAVVARALLAARAGESAYTVLGVEENRVYEYNVEVAQSASASDPVVEGAFEGLALEVTPTPGLSGETRLLLHARARVQRGAPRDFETGSRALGSVTQADYDQLVLEERLSFPKDGPRVVRLGDLGNGPGALALEVELTELR